MEDEAGRPCARGIGTGAVGMAGAAPVLLGSSRSEEEEGRGEKEIGSEAKWSKARRIRSGWGMGVRTGSR